MSKDSVLCSAVFSLTPQISGQRRGRLCLGRYVAQAHRLGLCLCILFIGVIKFFRSSLLLEEAGKIGWFSWESTLAGFDAHETPQVFLFERTSQLESNTSNYYMTICPHSEIGLDVDLIRREAPRRMR